MVFSPDVPGIYTQTCFPLFNAYSTMMGELQTFLFEALANNVAMKILLHTYFCEYIHEVNS